MAVCDKCRSKVKSLLKKLDKFLTDNAEKALEVTTKIKAVIDSPAAVMVTSVIPGDLDDKIRLKLSEGLTLALQYIGWLKQGHALTSGTITDFRDWLKDRPKAMQDATLHKIASKITGHLDGRYGDAVYDTAVQVHYTLSK